jgi:hypothetical protein
VTLTSALENALAPSKSRKHSNAPNGNTTSNVVPVCRRMNSAHRRGYAATRLTSVKTKRYTHANNANGKFTTRR